MSTTITHGYTRATKTVHGNVDDEVEEFVLDPTVFERPQIGPEQRSALRSVIEGDAHERAKVFGVTVLAQEPRRTADVALLWFQGDRPSVLSLVGGWTPPMGVHLHIAHAGPQGTRYELVLYAVYDGSDVQPGTTSVPDQLPLTRGPVPTDDRSFRG